MYDFMSIKCFADGELQTPLLHFFFSANVYRSKGNFVHIYKSIPSELSISKFSSKFGEKLKKVHFNKLFIISLFWLLSEFHSKFGSQIS
jgi:hypothetical protein